MRKLVVITVATLLVVSGCKATTQSWGYTSDNGPDTWSSLSADYTLCGEGNLQSPIDITSSAVSTGEGTDTLTFNYADTNFEIEDTGHSIEFLDSEQSNSITFNGVEYNLQQIHFHNESENTIDGIHYPLEAHFVHADASGQNLVLSVMFDIDEENQVLADSFNNVGEETTFNPSDLLPQVTSYYTFTGSLTTPPCSEGVTWIVFDQVLTLSGEQLAAFVNNYSNNNRPIQDLNSRTITYNS